MIRVRGARLAAALDIGLAAELFVPAAPELRAAADPVPLLPVVAMDEVVADIGLPAFTAAGVRTGAGVKVAVLDSGIDAAHPALAVAHQVETCGEPTAVPGAHGTHCAGILASRDTVLAGV